MVSHSSLSDSKSLQVSRTLFSILVDFHTTIVRMISNCTLFSKSSSPFNNPLGIVPSAPITISIIVTFGFHSYYYYYYYYCCVNYVFNFSDNKIMIVIKRWQNSGKNLIAIKSYNSNDSAINTRANDKRPRENNNVRVTKDEDMRNRTFEVNIEDGKNKRIYSRQKINKVWWECETQRKPSTAPVAPSARRQQ